jgi:hypothetical protein
VGVPCCVLCHHLPFLVCIMANPQQMIANAIQQGQAAVMGHPFAQKVAEGIKGLQQQHQSAMSQRRWVEKHKSSDLAFPAPCISYLLYTACTVITIITPVMVSICKAVSSMLDIDLV